MFLDVLLQAAFLLTECVNAYAICVLGLCILYWDDTSFRGVGYIHCDEGVFGHSSIPGSDPWHTVLNATPNIKEIKKKMVILKVRFWCISVYHSAHLKATDFVKHSAFPSRS